ncbi:MAG TPA: hypothetical protein VGR89_10140 [Puia sp.]|nr:hypothetical protein [Puia sp.]
MSTETRNLEPEQKYHARKSVAENTEDLDEEWEMLLMLGLVE